MTPDDFYYFERFFIYFLCESRFSACVSGCGGEIMKMVTKNHSRQRLLGHIDGISVMKRSRSSKDHKEDEKKVI